MQYCTVMYGAMVPYLLYSNVPEVLLYYSKVLYWSINQF